MALNSDATGAVACGVTAENGIEKSVIYVFDFTEEKPLAFHEISSDVVFDCEYLSDGSACLIGVFKRIGSAILGFVLTPIEAVLRALDWVPGIGDTMGSWADKIAEMKSGFDANASFTENQNLQIPPTKTAAVASSYSRQESYSNVNINLAEQLKSDNYGMVAPGVTVARTASGSF